MSHFTTLKTRLVAREHILKALKDIGLNCEVGEMQITGHGGQTTAVEIRVPARGDNWSFGFRKAGDSYELVGDWWGINDLDRAEFVQRLTQRYAYHATKDQLESQDFTVVEEKVEQDETIHLVLRRMV
jgi:hypothetical protein